MARSIAVVNFLPDAGHVFPLLRVASAFSERGYDVVVYLPQECETYIEGYNFQFISIGSVSSTTMNDNINKTLLKLSKSSIFYNAFSNYVDLSENFWDPLSLTVSKKFELVRLHLAEQRPVFLLSDDHVFRGLYAKLSVDLDIPLVLHTFEGYRRYQSLYMKIYGISSLSRQSQQLVEFLGNQSARFFRLGTRIRRFSDSWKAGEGAMERTVPVAKSTPVAITADDEMAGDANCQLIAISTGSGYLEQRYLKSELRICDELRAFGPLRTKTVLRLPLELSEWLEENDEPVIYVSFGSMVRLDLGFVKAILDGLALLNVRVLWSMSKAQQDELVPKMQIPASVRFEDFVPPLEVLALPNVRCGINHGGAGSIQDCLLSGKPMLCIPFMWDQPFNSSVVAHLKIGTRLWRRRVSAKTIATAVEGLLRDNQVRLRATNLAIELRQSRIESDVVDYILSHPSIMINNTERTSG